MYKVVQVFLFKCDWQTISIERARRVKKLPVILSLKEMEAVIKVTKNIKHKAIIVRIQINTAIICVLLGGDYRP